MNYKSIDLGANILDVDQEKRIVKACWSRMGIVDLDNDIMDYGCFTKTISERGPLAKNQIWSLVDHRAETKYALGKPSELYVEGDMLIAVTKIVDTECGSDAIKLYNAGCINEHSVGFRTIKSSMNNESGIRTIQEVMLYEGSAVLFGANPETPTLSLKGFVEMSDKDSLVARLERLSKAFKSGTFTDETFGLLEIEIKQIQSKILELSTLPAIAVEPPESELLKALRQSNLSLKNLI